MAKYKISICLGTSCYLRGATDLLEAFKAELKIEPGEETADHLYALEVGRCFGACALGPVVMINEVLYPNMTVDKIRKILNQYRTK